MTIANITRFIVFIVPPRGLGAAPVRYHLRADSRNFRDMFRCMGSNLPSEKAIKLLDYRGEKELAKTLRSCWLELDGEDRGGTFQNDFVGDRSSPRPDEGVRVTPQLTLSRTRDSLKDFQRTLFTGGPSDSGRWLRVGNRRSDTDQLVTAIEEQKSLMISV